MTNSLIRKFAAGVLTAAAVMSLTACGSAPSEASCKAAATKMLVEVFGQGVDHSDSPKPRECDGFTDAQVQTFVFGGPLDSTPIAPPAEPLIAAVSDQPAGCVADVKAQRDSGATSIRRSAACDGVSDDEIYMIATSR